jgi:hypothetical protein
MVEMGKYDHVLKNLPKLEREDSPERAQAKAELKRTGHPFHDDLVDTREGDAIPMHVVLRLEALEPLATPAKAADLALRYRTLRAYKELTEELLSRLDLAIEAVEDEGVTVYEGDGTASLKLDTGDTVRVQPEVYSSVEDKAAFQTWCKENGFEPQLQLLWQTMNSVTKQRLLEGLEPPAGVKASVKSKFVLTKAK